MCENPTDWPCGTGLVGLEPCGCAHMLIFKTCALPPGSQWGQFGFSLSKHLTLSWSLPLVHHYKETSAPTILILRGNHSDATKKSPGYRFRFESSCCRDAERSNMGRGGSITRGRGGFLLSHIWKIWRRGKTCLCLKNSLSVVSTAHEAAEGERDEWEAGKEGTLFSFQPADGQKADAGWQMLLSLNLNVASLAWKWPQIQH